MIYFLISFVVFTITSILIMTIYYLYALGQKRQKEKLIKKIKGEEKEIEHAKKDEKLIDKLIFHYKKKRQEETLISQLPDAIEMISRALKAGQALDGAFQEVGRHFPNPVGREVKTIYDEMSMGLPFETAIRNFENRYSKAADVKILCAALIIQRETGGNLTAILDSLSRQFVNVLL